MLVDNVSMECAENRTCTHQNTETTFIPFDKLHPRNIWVEKRLIVYERINALCVSEEVKKAMKDAVTAVIEIAIWCMREHLPVLTILKVVNKKCFLILDAKSVEEVNMVLNLVYMSRDTE